MQIMGTELFVKALKEEGVDILFGYPGGFAIDLFDALYGQEEIEVILPRHEQGLIHAADGYARSTGKTGVCLVTSGPGATNLVTGIATASYDSVPLVCFTGQVPTGNIGSDAFQEVDIVGITRTISKYGVTVRDRKDLGRIIKEAFYIAKTGRPGPVVVDIPKDIQLALGEDLYPKDVSIRGYKPGTGVHRGQVKRIMELLGEAKRPLILAGGGVNLGNAGKGLTQFAEAMGIPVATTIMGKGSIPTDHPLYCGNIGMHGSYSANMAVSRCDVLLSIGTRFNDRITSKIETFAPHARVIHIDIDSASISKNIKVDVPMVADAGEAIEYLYEAAVQQRADCQCVFTEWVRDVEKWRTDYPIALEKDNRPMVTPQKILEEINALFPRSIVVTDVGQHQMWTTQYLQMSEGSRLLTSGGLGTMGYGFPAAVGAQFGNPEKPVICISGDAGMQMNIQELATAVAHELPLILCVFNNSSLGMVRQWQQMFFDKRYSSTCSRRRKSCSSTCKGPGKQCPVYIPDFVKLAESYGARGVRVEDRSGIRPALESAAENQAGPTLIEFIIDQDELVLPMVRGGNPLTSMILDS